MQHKLKLDAPPGNKKPLETHSSTVVAYEFPLEIKKWRGMALIGEAPGAEETRLGHPFVGRSGQLLDKILERAKIDRKSCLVANVFRFQPPGNKVDHFFISKRRAKVEDISISEQYGSFGSNWCRSEFATEIEALASTLQKMKPKVVVSLGRTPLWALTGENGLMGRVGKMTSSRLCAAPVMPTYHPSYILRGNWGLQDEWLNHFLVANQQLG